VEEIPYEKALFPWDSRWIYPADIMIDLNRVRKHAAELPVFINGKINKNINMQ